MSVPSAPTFSRHEWILVVSSASFSVREAGWVGKRLPALFSCPGRSYQNALCPPAAAISSARLNVPCPCTSLNRFITVEFALKNFTGVDHQWFNFLLALHKFNGLRQVFCADNFQIIDDSCFLCIGFRLNESL